MQTLLAGLLGQVSADVPYSGKTIRRDVDDVGNDSSDEIARTLAAESDASLPEGARGYVPKEKASLQCIGVTGSSIHSHAECVPWRIGQRNTRRRRVGMARASRKCAFSTHCRDRANDGYSCASFAQRGRHVNICHRIRTSAGLFLLA
jgi:hypothetical protein